MHSAPNLLPSRAQRDYLDLISKSEKLQTEQRLLSNLRILRTLGLLATPAGLALGLALLLTIPIPISITTGLIVLGAMTALMLGVAALLPVIIEHRFRRIARRRQELNARGHDWWRNTAELISNAGLGELQIPDEGLHLQAEAVRHQPDGRVDTVRLVPFGNVVVLRGSDNQRVDRKLRS